MKAASVNIPALVGLSWNSTPSAAHAIGVVGTSFSFQDPEQATSPEGSDTVKSSVELNFEDSGHVFPGRPVSRPMKCTSICGIGHDSDRVVRGAERTVVEETKSVVRRVEVYMIESYL